VTMLALLGALLLGARIADRTRTCAPVLVAATTRLPAAAIGFGHMKNRDEVSSSLFDPRDCLWSSSEQVCLIGCIAHLHDGRYLSANGPRGPATRHVLGATLTGRRGFLLWRRNPRLIVQNEPGFLDGKARRDETSCSGSNSQLRQEARIRRDAGLEISPKIRFESKRSARDDNLIRRTDYLSRHLADRRGWISAAPCNHQREENEGDER
jgi:hypothetical protein